MSLTRQLLNDMRPLFQVFGEPFSHPSSYYGMSNPRRSAFDDPFFQSATSLRPSVDVIEDGNNYIVEADLPGVKKEDLDVRVGDAGRSVTIEGKIFRRRNIPDVEDNEAFAEESPGAAPPANTDTASSKPAEGTTQVAKSDQPTSAISVERRTGVSTASSTFSRTVWLPRPVNGSQVTAKLTDGVLTLTIPKADEKAVRVSIE